ncbi:MAG: DUF1156 domain-containing protein, partial [Halochromatium sp.]
TDYCCALCDWHRSGEKIGHLFNRQAIPMKWDFCEVNPLSDSSGNFGGMVAWVVKSLGTLPASTAGHVNQIGAQNQSLSEAKVVSADPPYFDNVPYSDLSDFFYVWLRRSLRGVYPDLFSTLTTPKSEELVAFASRHINKASADDFFMDGMTAAIRRVSGLAHAAFPATIYYAFKQSETTIGDGTSSSGWETFLTALVKAGFSVCGTWPLRTELSNRMRGIGTNALASSIVLVCRKRDPNADAISRRDFQRELREQMPDALETMIGGQTGQSPIAPVDLAQAAIGPGMAIYSKYAAVLNQDGSPMGVHDALVMINRAISDYLNPEGSGFDADTLFCNDWFSQYGWSAGPFGEADTLARAKGTSVDGVREAGVIESGGGKVRLFKWAEYPADWSPLQDDRVPVWEACHQMIGRLNQDGERVAGALLAQMPEQGEYIRQLAYHLYTLCERKKWAEEARAYNELIASWSAIVAASQETGSQGEQIGLAL